MVWASFTVASRRYTLHHPAHLCHTTDIRLVSQANVLVDKYGTPRIVGLGNASILPRPTVRAVEGGTGADRVPRSRVPGLTRPVESTNLTDLTHPTKASDMYAFGVMAWEVRTDLFMQCWSVRSLETGSYGTSTVLRDDRDRSNVLDADWG